MENTNRYGEWVRLVKETSGLSYPALAAKIGCNRASLIRWVMGQTCPMPLYARILVYLARDFRLPGPPPCERLDTAESAA